MISLFGKPEFDDPRVPLKQRPRDAFRAAKLQIAIALLWMGMTADRVFWHKRGHSLGWDRSLFAFWVVMLLFWLWNGWKSFTKYRAEQKVWN